MEETGITFRTIGQQIQCFYIGYLCISRPDITHKTLVDSELADEKNNTKAAHAKNNRAENSKGAWTAPLSPGRYPGWTGLEYTSSEEPVKGPVFERRPSPPLQYPGGKRQHQP